MLRFGLVFMLALVCCIAVVSCSPNRASPSNSAAKLTIATAANMQFVMAELTQAFSESTAIASETIVASSGKLTAQIQAGAPFDVFVSADLKYPTTLFHQGLTTQAPKVYAYGKLVLWTVRESKYSKGELWAALTDESIRHVAVANPKTAPYGAAAIAALKQAGIYDTIQPKLVFGESIAQVNAFVTSGAADMGFTAQSVVLSPRVQGQGQWEAVSPEKYGAIAQGIVILQHPNAIAKSKLQQAQSFYDFLGSNPGQSILQNFGYDVPQAPRETSARDD